MKPVRSSGLRSSKIQNILIQIYKPINFHFCCSNFELVSCHLQSTDSWMMAGHYFRLFCSYKILVDSTSIKSSYEYYHSYNSNKTSSSVREKQYPLVLELRFSNQSYWLRQTIFLRSNFGFVKFLALSFKSIHTLFVFICRDLALNPLFHLAGGTDSKPDSWV